MYRNVSTTLRCTLLDVEDLKVELKKVKDENDKLVLDRVSVENLKQTNKYLELKITKHLETEEELRNKNAELETKLHAFTDSVNLVKKLIADQLVGGKVGIGLEYDELRKASKK